MTVREKSGARWRRRTVRRSCVMVGSIGIAPLGIEPRFTAPKAAVLPLDEGAASRHDSARYQHHRSRRPARWRDAPVADVAGAPAATRNLPPLAHTEGPD